jgi:hypothetical protein
VCDILKTARPLTSETTKRSEGAYISTKILEARDSTVDAASVPPREWCPSKRGLGAWRARNSDGKGPMLAMDQSK